jgi:hypothetical protein
MLKGRKVPNTDQYRNEQHVVGGNNRVREPNDTTNPYRRSGGSYPFPWYLIGGCSFTTNAATVFGLLRSIFMASDSTGSIKISVTKCLKGRLRNLLRFFEYLMLPFGKGDGPLYMFRQRVIACANTFRGNSRTFYMFHMTIHFKKGWPYKR